MRTGALRHLGEVKGAAFSYDPAVHFELEEPQEITIYPPPLYIFSPGIRVYDAKSIQRFKGYLSSFKPEGFDEEGQPEATLTITVIPQEETDEHRRDS